MSLGMTVDNNNPNVDEKTETIAARYRRRAYFVMDHEIEGFMNGYTWAFPKTRPVGKLSAYYAWKAKG